MTRRSGHAKVREPAVHWGQGSKGDLPDVNVWLALSIKEHPHHQIALRYWSDDTRPDAWFCRVTMLGLVRLLTQPAIAANAVLSAADSIRHYGQILALPRVAGMAAEPAGVEQILQALLQPELPSRFLTDAYLAAFAMAGEFRLVTFDRDFERFQSQGLLMVRLQG